MRRAVILALALAAPAIAAPRQWVSVATPAPQGSYVIGNPAARVKLIEYVSYTCPHCGHFTRDAAPVLKARMIASGSTSLEVRSTVHDKFDLVAAMIARCAGPALFARVHDAFFARQDEWLARASAFDEANAQRLSRYAATAQYRALANGAGLSVIAVSAGMTPAAVDACLADPVVARTVIDRAASYADRINGTPTFELNGRLIEGVDWARLEPMLRAAGAK